MIDYVKISLVNYDHKQLFNSNLLEFFESINTHTGELKTIGPNGKERKPHQTAFYRGLTFKVYHHGPVYFSGSLHKYWNEGLHNYNLFDYNAFLDVLNDLNIKFGICPSSSQLRAIEVGVNVNPPIPTIEIIDNCLMHSTRPFEYKYHSDEGRYKQCEHSQYIIKLYDKALHYNAKGFNVKGEVLRFEIKYKKMQILNGLGIYTLNDIARFNWERFNYLLTSQWSKIIYAPKHECVSSMRLLQFQNERHWTNLMKNNRRSTFYKHRKELENHLEKLGDTSHGSTQTAIQTMVRRMSMNYTY